MTLSKHEKKMVAFLQRQHKAWPTTRWIILISCLLILAAAIFGFVKESVFYVLVVYGFSYVLGSWNGRPEVSLLLKLIEDRAKVNTSKEA